MDGKIIVYIAIIALLLGVTYGIHESMALDDAKREFAIAQQHLTVVEGQIAGMSSNLELRKEVAALLKAIDILKQEATTIRNETERFRKDEANSTKAYQEAILKTRQDSAGLALGEKVLLPNGTELKNARVQRVEGITTTIAHSEGVTKLIPDMLPKDLQDRFRFGLVPEDKITVIAPKAVVKEGPSTEEINKKKLDEARLNLEKLQKELPYLESQLANATQETSPSNSATKRFYAKNRVESLNQQIIALKRRIDNAALEVKKYEALQY